MLKPVGLKDIAQQTGFSIKTVSRALNNHPDVSEETKRTILAAAEQSLYLPNLVARSLRTRHSFTVGYVVPDITSEFFGKVGIALEKELRRHGYGLLVSFTEESSEKEIESLKVLLSKRVDGIVLATVGTTGSFLRDNVMRMHLPLVVIDNRLEGLVTNSVLHDNIHGAYLLTKHLIAHGHRKIGCITGPLTETSGKDRLEGYKRALAEHGIPMQESLVEVSNWRAGGGYDSARALLERQKGEITALFVANSVMALGVYKAFKKMSIAIPRDVAVVSFDYLEFTDALEPPLTTLESVDEKIGEIAAQLLLERVRDRRIVTTAQRMVRASIYVQKSCGC
jgi:LacI family transcriptional regulator